MKTYDYYIYRITCLLDGRTYIGKRQVKYWDNYYGSGKHITNAVLKYGKDNFTREILAEYSNITNEEISKIECEFIRSEWLSGHGEFNHACNSYGGDRYSDMPRDIYLVEMKKLSDSHKISMNDPAVRKKLSDCSKKLWADPEYRDKQVNAHIGKKSHLGFTLTDEQKKHLSDSHKGQVPWNKGKSLNYNKHKFLKPDGTYKITTQPNKAKHYHPDWIYVGVVTDHDD